MKKKITAILTASVIALSLVACGGAGTDAQSGTPEPAAEPVSTASVVESKGVDSSAAGSTGAESSAAGTEALAGEETEIQVFIAASLNTVMQEVAAAFNEQYPNVKITYNADSSGTLSWSCTTASHTSSALSRLSDVPKTESTQSTFRKKLAISS